MQPPESNSSSESNNQGASTASERQSSKHQQPSSQHFKPVEAPSINLPKGGGAIRGIDEKFQVNPSTGSASASVPVFASSGRSDFSPKLSLSYDSGSGNSPFGLGWNISIPAITRKTSKGLPKYDDLSESDVFILSGYEDLVPVLRDKDSGEKKTRNEDNYTVYFYRPRIEGLFSRIEKWVHISGDTHWRSISKENITTVYGETPACRLSMDERIYQWLIEKSYDDRGNIILYEYKQENADGVDKTMYSEYNRFTSGNELNNKYLKRIKYCNKSPFHHNFLMELVFDYGDHSFNIKETTVNGRKTSKAECDYNESSLWTNRPDPFSVYKPGFEVRTYRLCQRILMYHHMDELDKNPCLIRSTDLIHSFNTNSCYSYISGITQTGYKWDTVKNGYLFRKLPTVEYEYSLPEIQYSKSSVTCSTLENLPQGIDGSMFQLTDIDGEGLPGILTEATGGWYYKRALGNGEFGRMECIKEIPVQANLEGGHSFMDLAGDGELDLVIRDQNISGFFERNNGSWSSFKHFESIPNIDWNDPNLRRIDLNGDGKTDILITGDDLFTWYQSKGEYGYESAKFSEKYFDRLTGPAIAFSDSTQSIYLADMSGDGMSDIVRIKNGLVSYWPNLGYARFGSVVHMDRSPVFDSFEQFDQSRLRLADIDGTGTTDLIYATGDKILIWHNQSGNGWSGNPVSIDMLLSINSLRTLQVTDFLGTGTACLVWSSKLPGDSGESLKYVELLSEKPHLVKVIRNNMGKETRFTYAQSTKFYLEDKASGNNWFTRLPFPVHVVERIETYDLISKNKFVTSHKYHHGYFDGSEREFRGFGMVEQYDTDIYDHSEDNTYSISNLDKASYLPPVLTRTWYHLGTGFGQKNLSKLYESEYYREPNLSDEEWNSQLLPDTILPGNLESSEIEEACRSLKGAILRQEVYSLDGSDRAGIPYSVSERNFTIKKIQSKSINHHAVFFTHSRENIDFQYERNPDDPRISHKMVISVDSFGNSLRDLNISYPRRNLPERIVEQKETHLIFNTNSYINEPDNNGWYRTGLSYENISFEVVRPPETKEVGKIIQLYKFGFLKDLMENLFPEADLFPENIKLVPYQDWNWRNDTDGSNDTKLRLIEHIKTLYRKDDLTGSCDYGKVESLALPFETYKLSLTDDLINEIFDTRLVADNLQDAGYLKLQGHNGWWIPSGRIYYSKERNHSFAEEFQYGRDHFFLPHRFSNPYRNDTIIAHDKYTLLIETTEDAIGNKISTYNNYRVLQPKIVEDINSNITEVSFDLYGLVVGTAIKGKSADRTGDNLDNFKTDLSSNEVLEYFKNPSSMSKVLLGNATSRIIYDLESFMSTRKSSRPVWNSTLAREKHVNDLEQNENLNIQTNFSYSDGFGREIQVKVPAEPGIVDGAHSDRRWLGNGWTVFNNKGNPFRKYEPFFCKTFAFEYEVLYGVRSTLFYDPLARLVATLNPNKTFEKIVFNSWSQESWDVNDMILIDAAKDSTIKPFLAEIKSGEYSPSWYQVRISGNMGDNEKEAAEKTASHANTPELAHFDVLGRKVLSVENNGNDSEGDPILYVTSVQYDIEGNERLITDARGNPVMKYAYDMAGNRLCHNSMDSGIRWYFNDVIGNPVNLWDQRNHCFTNTYDKVSRLIKKHIQGGDGEIHLDNVFELIEYGEDNSDIHKMDKKFNLRGKPIRHFDTAGVLYLRKYDIKGNIQEKGRKLLFDYKKIPQWIVADRESLLELHEYKTSFSYDAYNRVVAHKSDDGSIVNPIYNEASLLERVEAVVNGNRRSFVENIDYNEKGQRERISYGNGVRTTYLYDPKNFRLNSIVTEKPGGKRYQELYYTYDPGGNIVRIEDKSRPTIFFNNFEMQPVNRYTYDPLYRLIHAEGREHIAQVQFGGEDNWKDLPFLKKYSVNDPMTWCNYSQEYLYDPSGNIERMEHTADSGSWKRIYKYEDDNNRLKNTSIGRSTQPDNVYQYPHHDKHGFIEQMPHIQKMRWNFNDELSAVSRQKRDSGTPETTYYIYDSSGQRVRKVTENEAEEDSVPIIKEESIYIDGLDIYKKRSGNNLGLIRTTLKIMDDTKQIALVESRNDVDDGSLKELTRYQFTNHLGTSCIELDDKSTPGIISYEEYHPYGTTAYQATNSSLSTSYKRYRYSGKERDEESGLYYYGARYYVSWLGRWLKPDQKGIIDGCNLYVYVTGNPVKLKDKYGNVSISSFLNDVVRYGDKILNRSQLGQNVQKDHIIAQEKISLMRTDSQGVTHYNPNNDPSVVVETGKATSSSPAKPHTLKTFHVPQADVPEIKRLKANGIRSISGDIVGPSRNAAIQSGMNPQSVDKGILGQLNNLHSSQTLSETAKTLQQYKPQSITSRIGTVLSKGGGAIVSTGKAFGGAVAQTVKSMIPGSELYDVAKMTGGGSALAGANIMAKQVAETAKATGNAITTGARAAGSAVSRAAAVTGAALSTAAKTAGGAISSAGKAISSTVSSAGSALVSPVSAGPVATSAVTVLAGVAAVGSLALAGETVRAAITGDKTPIDVADEYYGTSLGDMLPEQSADENIYDKAHKYLGWTGLF